MNSAPVAPTWLETLREYVCRVLHSYVCWIPCLQRQHQVHPLSTNAGRNKFLQLGAHRRIRIVHIDSKKLANSDSLCRKPIRHSFGPACDSSEDDYWFTRWTQPLKISNNCNCSFKRKRTSMRVNGNCDTDLEKQVSQPNNPVVPRDEASLRVFAIDFVQNILEDAVTHVSLSRPNDSCRLATSNVEPDLALQFSDVCTAPSVVSQEDEGCVNPSFLCSPSDSVRPAKASVVSQDDEGCVNPSFLCSPSDSVRPAKASVVSQEDEGCVNPSFLCSPSDSVRPAKASVVSQEDEGCVNPSFLCSPSDSVRPAKAKCCGHARRSNKKPLLFFLHGVGSSADVWWGLLRFFVSAGYEVLAPDMLGHGYSSAPDREAAYTFQHLLKDAVDIFDRFVGEHGRCVVVGHSYGCSLAAAVARYRTQVSHLVLISGGGPTPLAPSQQPPMFPGLRGCVEGFLVCGFKRDVLYAPCGKQMTSCATSSHDVPEYVLRHVARGQDWPEGDSTFHRRILVPTLLVHGMRDPHVTLVQECEMERTIPRSFLELIPNAGHLAMLETPAQLSHMINCFIEWWSR